MSFVSQTLPPTDILIEIGKFAVEEPGFVDFMEEFSASGFVLVYEEDEKLSPEEFDEIVRTRWNVMKIAWRLRNG